MKKMCFLCCLSLLALAVKAQVYPEELQVTDNGEFVVMHTLFHQVHILNTTNGHLIKHRPADSLNIYGGLQLYKNSLILMQCIKYNRSTVLLDFMGNALYTFPKPVIVSPSGSNLYELSLTEVHKLDDNFKVSATIMLEWDKLTGFFKIEPTRCYLSNDEKRIAICFEKSNGVAMGVFDMSNGKLIALFDRFKDSEKKKLSFAGFSPDGKYLIAGNKFTVFLMDVDKGKVVGEFEENPKNNRIYFTAAGFQPDSKKAVIVSRYKIYTLSLDKFEAIENINFGGEKITKVITTYEGFLNKKVYETTDYEYSMNQYYYWCGYTFSKDNKLLYAGIDLVNDAGKHTVLLNKMAVGDAANNTKYLLK